MSEQKPPPLKSPTNLWDMVSKTDPNMAKEANNGRFKFTSIDPQYQLLCATKQFGPYGHRWGLRNFIWTQMTAQGDCPVLMLEAEFFYPDPNTGDMVSFPIAVDGKLKPGDDIVKKLITSARSKALSFLGFNADVFMGKFDDAEYVRDLNIRFRDQDAFSTRALSSIRTAKDESALQAMRQRVSELVAEDNITSEKGIELYAEIEKRRDDLAVQDSK